MARGRTAAGSPARLRAVVEPVVSGAGYDLEDLKVFRAGRRTVVRVVVDSDHGVNLDAVATVSRAVSRALDEAERSGGEMIAGEYTLEVSSPGVERPLTLPRHWRRNVGRLVKVRAGERQVTGRVVSADEEGVALDVDGERLTVAYPDLGPGRVQLDFSRIAESIDEETDEDEEGEDEE